MRRTSWIRADAEVYSWRPRHGQRSRAVVHVCKLDGDGYTAHRWHMRIEVGLRLPAAAAIARQ